MNSFEQHLKELLIPLMKKHYQRHKTLARYESVLNFLPLEARQNLVDLIYTRIPELKEETRDSHPRKMSKPIRFVGCHLNELLCDVAFYENQDEVFDELINCFQNSKLVIDELAEFPQSLARIQNLFGLDEVHTKMLAALFIFDELDDKFNSLLNRNRIKSVFIEYHELFSPSKRDVAVALSPDGVFHRFGILIPIRLDRGLSLSCGISDFLRGVGSGDFTEGFLTEFPEEVISLSKFNIEKEKIEAIKKLLISNRPINILFEGGPGVGKTTMAYSFLKELGMNPIYLKHDIEETDDRRLYLYAAKKFAQQSRRVLIVDEADDIIGQGRSFFFMKRKDEDKAWINYFLDSTDAQIIWITNDTSKIADSTCRRFNYILNFKPLSFAQRRTIWENVITKYNQQWISELSEYSQLVRKYPIDAGSIDDAVFRTSLETIDKKAFLLHYLDQKLEFLEGTKRQSEELRKTYDVSAINMTTQPEVILESLRKYLTFGRSHNINLLFQGPSGTGKTEFVKYLAHKLDREVIIKTPAELSSKWVGETEKNIAKAFEEAEAREALLFLDEADAFFMAREGAQRHWEISQVNQMLIEMEKFKGILICSTNFMKNFDKASMRRFQFKVEFNYLTDFGKERLFKSFFPELSFEAVSKDLARLKNLAPGDFKNADQKLKYRETFTERDVLQELAHEVSYKDDKRTLGLH